MRARLASSAALLSPPRCPPAQSEPPSPPRGFASRCRSRRPRTRAATTAARRSRCLPTDSGSRTRSRPSTRCRARRTSTPPPGSRSRGRLADGGDDHEHEDRREHPSRLAEGLELGRRLVAGRLEDRVLLGRGRRARHLGLVVRDEEGGALPRSDGAAVLRLRDRPLELGRKAAAVQAGPSRDVARRDHRARHEPRGEAQVQEGRAGRAVGDREDVGAGRTKTRTRRRRSRRRSAKSSGASPTSPCSTSRRRRRAA
jgi:hypothetical protein